jgi:CRP-like cAMP-binding protein
LLGLPCAWKIVENAVSPAARPSAEALAGPNIMPITALVQAVAGLKTADRFAPILSPDQWEHLGACMKRSELASGAMLTHRGDQEALAYLVEQGELQVFVAGGLSRTHRIAVLRAGALVGEPALFCDSPRMATVEAMTSCVVWSLSRQCLETLATKSPALALAVLRAAGAVLAQRMRANLERGIPVV